MGHHTGWNVDYWHNQWFLPGSHFTAGCVGGGIMEESPVLDPERLDLTTTSVVKTDCSQVSCYSIVIGIIHHDTGIDHA